jgi:hypothetical protein
MRYRQNAHEMSLCFDVKCTIVGEAPDSVQFVASSEELNPEWEIKLLVDPKEQDYRASIDLLPGVYTNSFNSVICMVIGMSTSRVIERVEVDGKTQFRLTIEFEECLRMPAWVFYLKRMDDELEYWRSRCLLAEEKLQSIAALKDQPRDIHIQFGSSNMKFTGKIITSPLNSDVIIRSCCKDYGTRNVSS